MWRDCSDTEALNQPVNSKPVTDLMDYILSWTVKTVWRFTVPLPSWSHQGPCRGRTSCRCVRPWNKGCPPSDPRTSTPGEGERERGGEYQMKKKVNKWDEDVMKTWWRSDAVIKKRTWWWGVVCVILCEVHWAVSSRTRQINMCHVSDHHRTRRHVQDVNNVTMSQRRTRLNHIRGTERVDQTRLNDKERKKICSERNDECDFNLVEDRRSWSFWR